jgi:hypothetical protein
MECTTNLQTIQQIETPEQIDNKKITRFKQSSSCEDEESRKYRKYLAQQEALRRLERTKTQALVTFRR